MINDLKITILPAPGCRRSRKILEYLTDCGIPFQMIELDSPEGRELIARYEFRASPGILVNSVSINPFDLIARPSCRIDEEKAASIFIKGGE